MYRGICDFKKDYHPRTNIVKDEKGGLVTDCHSILVRWRKHFSQLLNIHGANDIRQTEIRTEEPLVPETSAFEVKVAIEELVRHKSPGIDQIPAELIKAVLEQFDMRPINLLFLFGTRRYCLSSGRSRSLYLSIRRAIKRIVVIIGAYHFCQLRTKFHPTSCCQG